MTVVINAKAVKGGSTAYDPSNVAITGGVIGGVPVAQFKGAQRTKLVVWGDSTANLCVTQTVSTSQLFLGTAWAQIGLSLAAQPLDIVNVGAHSGLRTDQIIPFFAADVAAFTPDYVVLPVATNNIVQGLSAASAIADISTMVGLIQVGGGTPVLMTVSCGDTIAASSSLRAIWQEYNALLRALATSAQLPLIDIEGAYIDPSSATSAPLTGFTDGSVHPNNKGAMRWARIFAEWLGTLPPRAMRSLSRGGLSNIANNPLFGGTGGSLAGASGTAPDGTAINKSAGATVTSSIVARTPSYKGNWWQIVGSMASNSDFLSLVLGPAFSLSGSNLSVGTVVGGLCDIEIDPGFVNLLGVDFRLTFTGSSGITSVQAYTPASASGPLEDTGSKIAMTLRTPRIAIPAGTTAIQPILLFNAQTTGAWSITARVGGVSAARAS